eukprot:scaffold45530_cov68-Phaeocystis_antarctica.AAC.4
MCGSRRYPDGHRHLKGLDLERGAEHRSTCPVVATREEAQLVVAQEGNVEVVISVVVHRVAAVDLTLLEVVHVVIQSNGYLEPIAARKRLVVEIDFVTRTHAGHLALEVRSDAGISLAAVSVCSVDKPSEPQSGSLDWQFEFELAGKETCWYTGEISRLGTEVTARPEALGQA